MYKGGYRCIREGEGLSPYVVVSGGNAKTCRILTRDNMFFYQNLHVFDQKYDMFKVMHPLNSSYRAINSYSNIRIWPAINSYSTNLNPSPTCACMPTASARGFKVGTGANTQTIENKNNQWKEWIRRRHGIRDWPLPSHFKEFN